MKKQLKDKIKSAYNIPAPQNKDKFFEVNTPEYKPRRGKLILKYASVTAVLAVAFTGYYNFVDNFYDYGKPSIRDLIMFPIEGTYGAFESINSEYVKDTAKSGADVSNGSADYEIIEGIEDEEVMYGVSVDGGGLEHSLSDYSISEEADERIGFIDLDGEEEYFEDSEESYEDIIEEPAIDSIEEEFIEEEPIVEEPAIIDDNAQAFTLTAGEWNDNDNWGFFTNLVNNNLISFPSYGLNPLNKISVTLSNNGEPVRNQKVELVSDEGVVWTSLTDKNGKAYLFYDENNGGLYVNAEGAEPLAVTYVELDEEQGQSLVNNDEFNTETSAESLHHDKTEVMFILDTTGSMGDEIMYLQKDFSSIAEEVYNENMTFSVNFYRDKGDTYITKCNPFTSDIQEVQSLLNNESARGGGDQPEAIAEILTDTIINGEWSEGSNKIAFLIFDAPPHKGTEDTIKEAIQTASAKGIHLVPVVASNADRDTELFGRAVAIMTNSNYVFLTDDSGVGESHLEPIIGNYEVELLHDIIVRSIREIAE